MGKEIFYIILLVLFTSCLTQKKNENIVDVKEAQIQVEQVEVEVEVQEISNNSNILDISLVAKDLTIIEESDLEKEVVVVYSEVIKEVEDDDEDEEFEGFDVDDIKLSNKSVKR